MDAARAACDDATRIEIVRVASLRGTICDDTNWIKSKHDWKKEFTFCGNNCVTTTPNKRALIRNGVLLSRNKTHNHVAIIMTPGVVVVNNNLIKPIVDATRELDPLDDDHPLQTTAFLGCCRLFLPVLDALGVAFKPAKADVGGNVERLSKKEKEFENVRAFGARVFFWIATRRTTKTRQRASSVFCSRPY